MIRSVKQEEAGKVEGSSESVDASLPDGLRCVVPNGLCLPEASKEAFTFSCDFRELGGPLRRITIEYANGKLDRWLCEDWNDGSSY